jgi:hypothetical protein
MLTNQFKNQRADWKKFKADVAAGKKPIISNLYLDDLRRYCFQLEFPQAGTYDSNQVRKWDVANIPFNPQTINMDKPVYGVGILGEWTIAVFDTSHGMYEQQEKTKTAGRWIRFVNQRQITNAMCCCLDNATGHVREWISGETYQQGDAKFYLPNGNIYTCVKIATNQPCINTDGTLNSEYWALKFTAPPCLYQYTNNGITEYRSKIHYNTWIKGHTYSKYDKVSWQSGWKLKEVLSTECQDIPPHLWAGQYTNVTNYSDAYPSGTTWSTGKYPKGKLVLDNNAPNIKVYRALKTVENTEQNNTIEDTHPEDLSEYWERVPELDIYWERIDTSWNFEDPQKNWTITPDYGNFIHDWDINTPTENKIIKYEIIYDLENENLYEEDSINCHPSRFFPSQVDPEEKFEKIIYAYKDLNLAQLTGTSSYRGQRDIIWRRDDKEKFPFNATQITDPSTLGPVFGVNRWYSYFSSNSGYSYFKSVPALANKHKWWDGNTYCNIGDYLCNAPYDQGNWRTNPKIGTADDGCTSLQNMIEVLLSQSHWKLPANSTYKKNWIKYWFSPPAGTPQEGNIAYFVDANGYPYLQKYHIYNEQGAWYGYSVDEEASWEDYPSVNEDFWGTNACGIETFLSQFVENGTKKYDYQFVLNANLQYIPEGVMLWAQKTESGDGSNSPADDLCPSAEYCLNEWDCYNPSAGNYRYTFRYSLGRATPFIRNNEMGEPAHFKDTWTPSAFTYNSYTWNVPSQFIGRANDIWYGTRTIATPKINDFCPNANFETITPMRVQGVTWLQNQPYKKGTVVNHNNISYYAKQDITDLTTIPSSNEQYEKLKINTFTISGNRATSTTEADNLKAGWMIFLFNMSGSTYPDISLEPDNMKHPYIVDVRYNETENKTYITVNEEICIGTTNNNTYFNKMSWNKVVSERHDYSFVDYTRNEDGSLTCNFYYSLQPELLIDLYDLLHLLIYKEISSTCVEAKIGATIGAYGTNVPPMTLKNMATGWLAKNLKFDDASVTNGYTITPDSVKDPGVMGSVGTGATGVSLCYTNPYGSMFSKINSNSTTQYLNYRASGISLGWASTLKNLPKTILAKVVLYEMWGAGPREKNNEGFYFRTGNYWNMPQSTTIGSYKLSNYIVPWSAEREAGEYQLKTHYNYLPLSADGRRYWAKPENYFPYIQLDGMCPLDLPYYEVDGWADMNMIWYAQDKYIIILNLDDEVDQSFYTPNYYHVDAPRILVEDTKCPEPNPPIHYKDPYAYLTYVLPYWTYPDENEDGKPDIPIWNGNTVYNTGDKVVVEMNEYKQLFQAITTTTADPWTLPINKPTEWEWILPYAELRMKAESCVCQDKEASDPVSYQLFCKQDESLNRPYTTDRQADILLRTVDLEIDDVSLPDETILGNLNYVSWQSNVAYTRGQLVEQYNYMYKVIVDVVQDLETAPWENEDEYYYCKTLIPTDNSSGYSIGDIVEVIGTKLWDRETTITDTGTDYIEINIEDLNGRYLTETANLPTGSYIINRTKSYNHTIWLTDPQPPHYNSSSSSTSTYSFADYEFAWQAEDNAHDIQGVSSNNETEIGKYETMKEPEDYIEFYKEQKGKSSY